MEAITQLDIGAAFSDAMTKSYHNHTLARSPSWSERSTTARFECYITIVTRSFRDSIAEGTYLPFMRDILSIQHIRGLIAAYASSHADGFLMSLEFIIAATDNLLYSARRHPQIALLLDSYGPSTASPPPRATDMSWRSSSDPVYDTAPLQLRESDFCGLGEGIGLLADTYPEFIGYVSEWEDSSDDENSSRASVSTTATSFDEDISDSGGFDGFSAQMPKASPPPAIRIA